MRYPDHRALLAQGSGDVLDGFLYRPTGDGRGVETYERSPRMQGAHGPKGHGGAITGRTTPHVPGIGTSWVFQFSCECGHLEQVGLMRGENQNGAVRRLNLMRQRHYDRYRGTRKKAPMPTLMESIAAASRQPLERDTLNAVITAAAARLAELDSLPKEPAFGVDEGCMVWWEMVFVNGSRTYTYGAVKCADGSWYTTGPKSPNGYRWERLMQWIRENTEEFPQLWVVTAMEAVN